MRLLKCDSCHKITECSPNNHYDPDYEYIHVEANEDADHANLCSWDCLAAWAMAKALDKRERKAVGDGEHHE